MCTDCHMSRAGGHSETCKHMTNSQRTEQIGDLFLSKKRNGGCSHEAPQRVQPLTTIYLIYLQTVQATEQRRYGSY